MKPETIICAILIAHSLEILWATREFDATVYRHSIYAKGRLFMIKNLVKQGNSWALVIDRPILDLLKMNPESPLEITTDGESIRVAPVTSDNPKQKLRDASRKVNNRYSKTFKKLAE